MRLMPCVVKSKERSCNYTLTNIYRFVEHQHLLIAALSSLKSAKNVINSMSTLSNVGSEYKGL